MEAAKARIATIEADYIVTSELEAAEARIATIEADYIVTSQLEAAKARIATIEADYIVTSELEAAEARIATIVTSQLEAYEVNADKIVGGTISSSSINIGYGNFIVESNGDVTIKSGSINLGNGKFQVLPDGTVVAEEFRLNTGGVGTNVSIDTDGKLRAENAEIMGNVITDDIHVTKVIFSDTVEMEMASESSTQIFSYTASGGAPFIEPLHNGFSRVHVLISLSQPLKAPRVISYTYSFNNGNTGNYYERTIDIFFTQTDVNNQVTQKGGTDDIWDDGSVFNLRRKGVYPSSFTQSVTTGFTALGVNSAILPSTDDAFDLGTGNKRWRDIYSGNSVIQTSDLRKKKEVNYDISQYDQLFDRLKPVSYKFIDGQAGRKHLGFISQDIKAGLDEIGMGTVDFAGFIKSLLPKSKEKAPEDLTEDDYVYGIRYSELHAMEVRQIQLLKDYIQKLEARIAALESKEGS